VLTLSKRLLLALRTHLDNMQKDKAGLIFVPWRKPSRTAEELL